MLGRKYASTLGHCYYSQKAFCRAFRHVGTFEQILYVYLPNYVISSRWRRGLKHVIIPAR